MAVEFQAGLYTNTVFVLGIFLKRNREGQKELHCLFVDLEKFNDRA